MDSAPKPIYKGLFDAISLEITHLLMATCDGKLGDCRSYS